MTITKLIIVNMIIVVNSSNKSNNNYLCENDNNNYNTYLYIYLHITWLLNDSTIVVASHIHMSIVTPYSAKK